MAQTPSASSRISRPSLRRSPAACPTVRSEEHTSELQSQSNLVCRLLLEKKKQNIDVRPRGCVIDTRRIVVFLPISEQSLMLHVQLHKLDYVRCLLLVSIVAYLHSFAPEQ